MTIYRDPAPVAATTSVWTGVAIWRMLLCTLLFMASACQQIGKEAPAPPAEAVSGTKLPVSLDGAPQPQNRAGVTPLNSGDPLPQPQVAVEAAALQDEDADSAAAITKPRLDSEVVASVAPRLIPPKPEPQPSSLIGVRKGDLIARFGAPGLFRREPPAELWQFAGDGCVLLVYLYENMVDRFYQVTHIELLPRGDLEVVPPDCFRRLVRDKPQPSG
jgi:hypothetical protein